MSVIDWDRDKTGDWGGRVHVSEFGDLAGQETTGEDS